jgi:predicted DNA-binding protein (MmcQ/YjbR family)
MNYQELKQYCLSKKGARETYPFDTVTAVFKVGSKMFALTSDSQPLSINLKCNPELAEELRVGFSAIKPGYHMSKKHWNTVFLDSSLPDDKVRWLIDHSYDLVLKRLKKSEQFLLDKLPDK